MSVFSDRFELTGGPRDRLHALFSEATGVDYTCSAAAGTAAATDQDVSVRWVTTGDVAGGTRDQQQPRVAYVKDGDTTRSPRRGDQIDDGTDVWRVVDVTHKQSAGEFRLTVQHLQLRG